MKKNHDGKNAEVHLIMSVISLAHLIMAVTSVAIARTANIHT
jgi:hypothetical protein